MVYSRLKSLSRVCGRLAGERNAVSASSLYVSKNGLLLRINSFSIPFDMDMKQDGGSLLQ